MEKKIPHLFILIKFSFAISLIMLSALSHGDAKAPSFTLVKTGLLPLYDYDGIKRQDISGAAISGDIVILGDDGGPNAERQEVRITDITTLLEPATLLKRQVKQRDIEGVTASKDTIYITSSMSQVAEESDDYLVLAEMNIDPSTKKVIAERYAYLREPLVNSLRDRFQNQDWYGRIATSFAKEGGLNIEGLSISHLQKGSLVFGLRSPLWSVNFGSPKFGSKFSLTQGEAILMHVKEPFGSPSPQEVMIETLNLKGNGIRSIEYIPQLLGGGYIISAGPVEKDSSAFSLWWYQPNKTPVELNIEEFKHLCRPESITFDSKSRHLSIISEQSGDACAKQKYTYIELAY